jgi:hypothetical protein
LFRKVSDPAGLPTILLDEADATFGPRAAKEHEDLRALINAGHRKGAIAGRCAPRGNSVMTEDLPAYCAVALSGLGDLPDTVMTRAVIVRMRRRSPDEAVEPFRHREHAPLGHALRDELAEWSTCIEVGVWPEMPVGVVDRNADVWEALLAVADAAGGEWPERARSAAMELVTEVVQSPPGLGVQLLADLRIVFDELGQDSISTHSLLEQLNGMDEAPWGNLRGRELDSRDLAKRLRPYEVRSKNVRTTEGVVKGYTREDLADAWSRYLSPFPETAL